MPFSCLGDVAVAALAAEPAVAQDDELFRADALERRRIIFLLFPVVAQGQSYLLLSNGQRSPAAASIAAAAVWCNASGTEPAHRKGHTSADTDGTLPSLASRRAHLGIVIEAELTVFSRSEQRTGASLVNV